MVWVHFLPGMEQSLVPQGGFHLVVVSRDPTQERHLLSQNRMGILSLSVRVLKDIKSSSGRLPGAVPT